MAVNAISGINPLGSSLLNPAASPVSGDTGIKFGDMLKAALSNVNTMQNNAQELADQFAAGLTDNIHEVMIAGEKADIALQFTMQVRNKILDAYNEIMRMQV